LSFRSLFRSSSTDVQQNDKRIIISTLAGLEPTPPKGIDF
jgi:hypothetical protein